MSASQQPRAAGAESVARRTESENESRDAAKTTDATTTTTASRVQLLVVPTSAARVAGIKKVVLNELLAYVECYRHNSTDAAIQKVVLTHFSHDDIAEAKCLLVQELQSVSGIGQYITDRRNSVARPAHEAEVDDIIGMLDVADTKRALDVYAFVASNMKEMPKYGPEEINLGVVVDRQVQMEAAIASLSSSVQSMTSRPSAADPSVVQQTVKTVADDLQQQLAAFNVSIGERLDHLSAVCSQLAENAAAPRNDVTAAAAGGGATTHPGRYTHDTDRSMNLVLFGVAEDRDATAWRRKVDQVLSFVAGSAVDVCDMFRIGRFAEGKVRPVLVKLRTTWDKRIILSNCGRLKNFGERVFISADESIEERRKRMLARIKSRAEQQGKSVLVIDGVLLVDNTAVFSLKDGNLNNNHGQPR